MLNRLAATFILTCLLLYTSFGFSQTASPVTTKKSTEADSTVHVNGKNKKSKIFTLKAISFEYGQVDIPDQLSVEIGESGFVGINFPLRHGFHYFATGEVEQFLSILQAALENAKEARFTKRGGNFRIGDVGGELFLNMTTYSGGMLCYFSLITKSQFQGFDLVEDRIGKDGILNLISIFSQKDVIVSELSGENAEIKVVKVSISKPGDIGAENGLSLKITKSQGTVFLTEDVTNFKVHILKTEKKLVWEQLNKALKYIKKANNTLGDMPDKKFVIASLGGTPVNASVEGMGGNAERYLFCAKVLSEGEKEPWTIYISEEQLTKLVGILR